MELKHPQHNWILSETSNANTKRHRTGQEGWYPYWGIYIDHTMKEYLKLRPESLGIWQCFIHVHGSLFSFETEVENKNTWNFTYHTKGFYFPKVKCTEIGWYREQEWTNLKEKKVKEKSLSFWRCNCVFSLWTSERIINSYSEWEKATETGGLLLDPLNKRFIHYISILRQFGWSFFFLFYGFIDNFLQ